MSGNKVTFLNPRTCGIYKSGGLRYKTDAATGRRTDQVDNELIEAVESYVRGQACSCRFDVDETEVFAKELIVPTYYDQRYNARLQGLWGALGVESVSVGELVDSGVLCIREGHGSPGNDQRTGCIPYIKVSDIRAMRLNVNPTNLVADKVATRYWHGDSSGIAPWDLITPNRASSNIGEFAIVLPGEEQVVLTKEVFVLRIVDQLIWSPFYLFWCLCLRAIREQWRRIALMQTNREDCGNRHREILLPRPPSKQWAEEHSRAFRTHFEALSTAREAFTGDLRKSGLEFIASTLGACTPIEEDAAGEQ